MSRYAEESIRQKAFEDLRQEAIIRLFIKAQVVRREMDQLCEAHGISLVQFNVLRILKGVHPGAHPRSEISKRMIDNSDVTRLIDRMEKSGLVKRVTAGDDRRQSLTTITVKGIRLLQKLEAPFHEMHARLTAGFTKAELETFISLVKKF